MWFSKHNNKVFNVTDLPIYFYSTYGPNLTLKTDFVGSTLNFNEITTYLNHILTIHVLGQEKKSPELWIKFLPAWKVMYFICAEYHIILVSFSIKVIEWILINHLVY